jgi:hypothetical protein
MTVVPSIVASRYRLAAVRDLGDVACGFVCRTLVNDKEDQSEVAWL